MEGVWVERDNDPWLLRARALKNRIRDRFRVAVHRRRHRLRLRESDYTLVIRRCSQRIRGFFKDPHQIAAAPRYSSSASLRFHRKKTGLSLSLSLSPRFKGGWVHIFPEGSRSRDGGKTVGPTKRGVGRLVTDADTMPIVLPFVHSGMQDIMPIGTKFPNIGRRVIVVVGDPINFDDLLPDKSEANDSDSRGIVYDLVSSRIGLKLQELKIQADELALERHEQIYVQNGNTHSVWQHVDWELFGMDSMLKSSDEAYQIDDKTQDIKKIKQLQVPLEESNISFSSKNRLCYEGGILSRVRGYMNPCELMGFAARGLFVNGVLLEGGGEKMGSVQA